ncbi:hypothetical protein UFOVP53_20 [uncultured Caudovirales phage]|uniref:Uncharacterized protein n=1 Tax=uncultured Caudovirales phage TaxID=2100421 RepID=A0A6J5KWT7_9CAUD|nr:hypothetical protein UFOVP53_20 [uncultured Caudovirales phage]
MNLLENKYVKIGVVSLLLLGAGYGVGKFSNPAKVITKTEIKEVVKVVEVVKEKKDVKTETRVITHPDGTKEEVTVIIDRTATDTNTDTNINRDIKNETITTRDLGLSIQALALAKSNDLGNREYGVLIKKRIISNISGTILATQKGTVGIAIGLDF